MNAGTRAAKGMSCTAAALGLLFLAATAAQLPAGQRDTAARETFRLFWPVGMRLFTNAAEREFVVAYHQAGGGAFVPITRTAGDRDHLGGLDRAGYADLVRLLATVDQVPDAHWQDCAAAEVSGCAAAIAAAPRMALNSHFKPGTPCGPAVFTVERPSRAVPVRHVVRIAVVDLRCAPR
ncbi:hypothetical protein SAMN05216553_105150 [Lentzea fradiae]|uniref:Antimicrobial peptide system protein, SdpA family n=1 Tax=Lentzea fradiae TaxID=200378 RepID=A0A1G7R6M8_9PSEU|nr:hypothetical protein [Lentzea fradiae]SDG06367.1 hypothetical protein SAMN05216553_105150 [Lentzea fradiae]